ncbi:MAG TPA: response regulator [Myxococcaceae bacterium]|jgi:two-component system sensor histidine kinase and response regulator WspE
MNESAREKLLKQFRDLVTERLQRITRHVISLEEGPDAEAGRSALRDLHGLKGEARMMGFQEINTLVHEMEDLVKITEPSGFRLTGGSIDALLVAADAVAVLSGATSGTPPEVSKLTDWLKQRTTAETTNRPATPQPPPPVQSEAKREPAPKADEAPSRSTVPPKPPAAPPPEAKPPAKTSTGAELKADSVRISLQALDALTTQVTNLNQVARRRELAAVRRIGMVRELASMARAAEELGPAGSALGARINKVKDLAAELHRQAKLLANEELRSLTQVSEEIQGLRMLPLSVLFDPFPVHIRNLAKKLNKEPPELVVEGEAHKADRTVVEALRDPLMHMVSNALDHGLEPRDERVQAGKPPRGRLILRATREGDRIVLRVEDDGRGLDPALLRKVAVRRGFMDEATAHALSDQAARDLIFLPGFTSMEEVTNISGRGIGLDVVRVRMQGLGGDAAVTSTTARGTVFELRVPVSLTVAPLLFIQVGEEKLSLTAAHVVQAVKLEAHQIQELAGRPAVRLSDEVLPFASIASILGIAPERPANEGELVLLVRGQGATAAISVDRVLEERVQPILPLKGVLARFGHLSGATSLADGTLAMVLSAAHLVSTARGVATYRINQAPRAPEERRHRILVVDDSPLTRELICSLLEAVGYEVVPAADGQEAFDRVGKEAVDMVVTDLEMPRMDGLELTRRLKGHATLRSLPVVIITTRGSEADRRRGMEAGADGYVAKGDLARQDLVDVVARLLG